jgi:hypothetical protein
MTADVDLPRARFPQAGRPAGTGKGRFYTPAVEAQVKTLRNEKEWTTRQIAEHRGCSTSTVRDLAKGLDNCVQRRARRQLTGARWNCMSGRRSRWPAPPTSVAPTPTLMPPASSAQPARRRCGGHRRHRLQPGPWWRPLTGRPPPRRSSESARPVRVFHGGSNPQRGTTLTGQDPPPNRPLTSPCLPANPESPATTTAAGPTARARVPCPSPHGRTTVTSRTWWPARLTTAGLTLTTIPVGHDLDAASTWAPRYCSATAHRSCPCGARQPEPGEAA